MSRSALALVHDADSAKSSATRAGGVRVSHPGDSFELEADRVADTVAQGGRIASWSLSASSFDGVHRQAAPTQPEASLGEIAGKVAEALLATPAGKKALDSAASAATSPAGMLVTGSTAIGVFAALGKAGKPLPAQVPAIPLDFIHPGLSVKLTWHGPVNQPTDGSIAISYSPEATEKKPAQSAHDQQKPGGGLPGKPSVGPVGTPPQKSPSDLIFEKWQMNRLKAIGNVDKPKAASSTHDAVPAEKKPEVKPAQAPAAAHDAEKKEEIPVQRKAETTGPISTGSADVDTVLRSSGQPLDRATRREMESRFGYDFSHVRLHTDNRAAASAQSLSAKAYTVGSDVVFAPGRFAPQTTEGRHLLAHELTHVVQQTTKPERAHPAVRPAPQHVQRSWSALDLPGAGWVVDKVRGLRGYKLVCTIVGHDLFDDSIAYERSASTIAQGVLELIPYGQDLYEKLAKAGRAIEKAYHWLEAEFKKRNLTLDGIYDVLDRAVHAFSGWHPIDSGEEVIAILMEPVNQLIDLAGVIGKKILEFILEGVVSTFGETGQKVWAFFQRAANVIGRIAAHPLQFGMNLLKAVGEGFKNFFAHIWDHLSEGVKTWVYEELDLPKDIEMPKDFTLGSMFKLLLQVLGLTWAHRRPQLVEKLEPIGGETVVYFFETIADKAGDVIKRIKEHGFSAIKDMIVEQASDIFHTLVESLKSWIATEFIEQGLKLIGELSNPAGELIKIVESIIDTVMFVIEKAKQLEALVTTVVNALSDIVDGNTAPAAQKIEDTLANLIPLLLRFIAGQFGISGIGKKISDIIKKIRAPLDNLIGRLLDILVDKIKPLWDKAKDAFMAKMQNIKDWWTKPGKFTYGDEEHELVVKGEGDKPEVFVHSTEETPLMEFLKTYKASPKQIDKAKTLAKGLSWKDGKLESMSKKEAGYNHFIALTDLMDKLKSKVPPPCDIHDNDAPEKEPFGGATKAWAFLAPGHGEGTEPSGTRPVMDDLGYLKATNEKYYVRGHLISNKLGGSGDTWKNLTPITNGCNQRMEADVESVLKQATENSAKGKGTNYYYYEVNVSYGNPRVPSDTDRGGNQKSQAELDARSDIAEKRLKQVSWIVKDAEYDWDAKKWNKTNKTPSDETGAALPSKARSGSFDPKLVRL
ncbi:MAG: DUF4157 domain-containing protein [Terracidiphilus sp.]|jgi:hypothetical protein